MTEKELIQEIRQIAKKVKPSHYFFVMSREKILSLIEAKSHKTFHGFFFRKWMSSAMVVVLVLFIMSPLFSRVPDVQASYIGEATLLRGTMKIEHGDGKKQDVDSKIKLKVGDMLVVAPQSEAEIYFIDESTSLLRSNTILTIDNVLINQDSIRDSIVSVVLGQGEIVNKVSKEQDMANMQVKTPTSIVEAKNSNFSVKITSNGTTEVKAITNSVKVKALSSGTTRKSQKVLAEAQAIQGYKVTVGKNTNANMVSPIAIESDSVYAANSNMNTPLLADNDNENANVALPDMVVEPLLALNYMEVAQVKIYQAIGFLNNQNEDEALNALRDYRQNLIQVYNSLTNGKVHENMTQKSITTIVAPTFLDDVTAAVSSVQNVSQHEELLARISQFRILEKAVQEKIALSTITVMVTPDNRNQNNDPVTEKTETSEADVLKKIRGNLSFNIQNLKNLVLMQESLSDNQSEEEIDGLIHSTVVLIANDINSIEDWKEQQDQMKYALALLPNQKVFEHVLQKLMNLASDRVGFIISEKLKELR